jgi:isoquinoline 1-oxidoreductase alpha subunit
VSNLSKPRSFALTINGARHTVVSEPERPLLWLLRDRLGLTGTKFGCGQGVCGACSVMLGDDAVRSCSLSLGAVGDRPITTIEGLAATVHGPALQQAWLDVRVSQCGYCQAGMLIAAAALLRRSCPQRSTDVQEGISNLCRCGSYPRVVRAVLQVAQVEGKPCS